MAEKINVGDTLSVHYWKNPRGVMWLKKWYLKTAAKPSGRKGMVKRPFEYRVRQIGTVVMFIAAGVFVIHIYFNRRPLIRYFKFK